MPSSTLDHESSNRPRHRQSLSMDGGFDFPPSWAADYDSLDSDSAAAFTGISQPSTASGATAATAAAAAAAAAGIGSHDFMHHHNYTESNFPAEDQQQPPPPPPSFRSLLYDSSNHFEIMFQMHGSVWKDVLPFCFANVVITGIIICFNRTIGLDLTFSDKGHGFMSLIISFLVVSRASIAVSRYKEAASHLSTMHRSCREITQSMAVYTRKDMSESAKEWRNEVAYRLMLMLRLVSAALEHRSSKKSSWDVPELGADVRAELKQGVLWTSPSPPRSGTKHSAKGERTTIEKKKSQQHQQKREPSKQKKKQPQKQEPQKQELPTTTHDFGPPSLPPRPTRMRTVSHDVNAGRTASGTTMTALTPKSSHRLWTKVQAFTKLSSPKKALSSARNLVSPMRWAHTGIHRTLEDENLRIPIRMGYRLRLALAEHEDCLEKPFDPVREGRLMAALDTFMTAYHGVRTLISIPFPFPLVQMARTFLFFYIFSLPFALLSDISKIVQNLLLLFIITYGFVGLEYVSIELDDPFGSGAIDLDHLGMARMVFEDMYLTIYDVDGLKWADKLRARMTDQTTQNTLLEAFASRRAAAAVAGSRTRTASTHVKRSSIMDVLNEKEPLLDMDGKPTIGMMDRSTTH